MRLVAKEFPDMAFSVPGGTEVNALDNEMMDLMAAANFHKVLLAIEAGDQSLQEALIDKKVKIHRVPEVVDYLKSKGIETRALFMIGFPDETKDQIARTMALAQSLQVDDFYIALVTPLPGTPLYDECVRRGLFVDGFDINNIRFSIASIRLPEVDPLELEQLRRTMWQKAFEQKRQRLARDVPKERRTQFLSAREYELVGFKSLQKDVRETPAPAE